MEQLARSVAQATASCLLEEAEREPALAAVLTEVYAGADARG